LFSFNATPTTAISPLSLHDALPIYEPGRPLRGRRHDREAPQGGTRRLGAVAPAHAPRVGWHGARPDRDGSRERRGLEGVDRPVRSEEHTSELQSRENLVCRLLLEKK